MFRNSVLTSKRESQAVLDSIKENDFHGALKCGYNNRIGEYVPKEMAAKSEYIKLAFLFFT
jgi:hypothetical protein